VVRNYVVDNLTSGKSKYGVDIQGLEKAPIFDVQITNTTFANVADGNIVKNVKGVRLDNVKLNGLDYQRAERITKAGRSGSASLLRYETGIYDLNVQCGSLSRRKRRSLYFSRVIRPARIRPPINAGNRLGRNAGQQFQRRNRTHRKPRNERTQYEDLYQ
jgi:hypothetical protein